MTTKEYLRQARTLDKRIDNKLEQVERLKSLRERVTTVITDMPRGGGDNDRLNTITSRIWELEKEINEDIDILVDVKAKIIKGIDAVADDRYRLLLEYKYLLGYSWEDIAEKMDYDIRWVYELHGRALYAFRNTAC